MRREPWRNKPMECRVCVDSRGFLARPCIGCGKQKVMTPGGTVVSMAASQAKAYRALVAALDGGQQEMGGG